VVTKFKFEIKTKRKKTIEKLRILNELFNDSEQTFTYF